MTNIEYESNTPENIALAKAFPFFVEFNGIDEKCIWIHHVNIKENKETSIQFDNDKFIAKNIDDIRYSLRYYGNPGFPHSGCNTCKFYRTFEELVIDYPEAMMI